jgi:NAD(P)H-flavin reductase/ferredoxin
MSNLHFYNRVFPVGDGQTVLDVLLENGQDIPYSCKMGVCVTCVMQVVEGEVAPETQAGLRNSMIEQGHFLPCVCQPDNDLHVVMADRQDLFSPATVRDIEHLKGDICRLFLEPATPLYYRAGQFMNLRREDGLSRSYSLASVPSQDGRLEFHIKRFAKGQMSNWIMDDLKSGDHLEIQGPFGNCYYQPEKPDQNMLLVGNGTGLAPLIGIARDALASGHKGPVYLYHGSHSVNGVYLGNELRSMEVAHQNFHYIPCVSGDIDGEIDGLRAGRADDIAFADQPDLAGWRVFLCGYPPMVHSAKDRSLLAGAKIEDIYTDPYELKDLRKIART